jgi:hypothetical protein
MLSNRAASRHRFAAWISQRYHPNLQKRGSAKRKDASAMTLTTLIWFATACYGLHILEEYQLDWRDWARKALGLPVEWSDFYVVNALVIVLGIVAANLAVAWPTIALTFPALMLINGAFFHVLPFIRMKGRFSPGLITAIVLFFPVGIACYVQAIKDGVGASAIIVSFILGAVLMAYPVVLLLIKDKPYFRQNR